MELVGWKRPLRQIEPCRWRLLPHLAGGVTLAHHSPTPLYMPT